MATAKKTAAVQTAAAPAISPDMMAMFQQFMAAQAASAKPVKAGKETATDHAAVVIKAVEAAGGKVVRAGKSGLTPKGLSKAWVDVKIGNVRIQGNAFVIESK